MIRTPRVIPGLVLGALLPLPAVAESLVFESSAGRLEVPAAGISGAEVADGEVLILLEPATAQRFADLTGRTKGQPMAVTLCGKTLMHPVVRERIDSGRLAIAVDHERAPIVTDILRGTADCAGLDDL